MKQISWLCWLLVLLLGCEPYWIAPADDSTEAFVKLYGLTGRDRLADFAPLDGGYLLLGSSDSLRDGLTDLMLIQTDTAGNQRGESLSFGSDNLVESALRLLSLRDGWLLIGNQVLPGGREQGYLVALDANLAPRWSRTLGRDLDGADSGSESFILADAVLDSDQQQLYWLGTTTDVDPLKNTDGDTLPGGDTQDLWVGRLDLSSGFPTQQWQQRYGFKAADQGVALGLAPNGDRLLVIGHSQFPANQTRTRLLLVQLRTDGFLLDQQTLAPLDERAVDLAYDPQLAAWRVLSYELSGTVHLRTVGRDFAVQEQAVNALAGTTPSDLFLDASHRWITGQKPDGTIFYLDQQAAAPTLESLGDPNAEPTNRGGRIRSASRQGEGVLIGATLGWADGGEMMMLARMPSSTPSSQ